MLKYILSSKDGTPAEFEEGRQIVSQYACPPMIPQKNRIFSRFLTDDGLVAGSKDLGVNGSSTEIPYWMPADNNNDIYTTRINFVIGYGASAGLWQFADSAGALTNGVRLSYTDTHGTDVEIANFKKNSSFLRYALTDGIIPTSWELRHLGANNDYGFLLSIDVTNLVPPYGIKLDRGTNQKITILIRDNCTDADDFDCCVMGFERFE